MLWTPQFLLAFALLVSKSVQQTPTDSQLCGAACKLALESVMFGTTVSTGDSYCQDTLRLSSIFFCIRLHCSTPAEIQTGVEYVEDPCRTGVHIETPSYESVIASLSEEAITAIPVVEYTLEPSRKIVNTTVVPTEEFFLLAYKTWDDLNHVDKDHYEHSWIIYSFWGLVLLIGMGNRLFASLIWWKVSTRRTQEDPEAINRLQSSKSSSFGGVERWVRRHIVLPGTFGYRHQQPWGWCTIPTRIQSLTVFAFVGLNIILCSVKYHSFPKNLIWSEENQQIWTYVTDRAGFLAVANLPLLWVFAGRNDVFLWFTGWNFATFNVFHRYLARVVTVEAIVHSIGYTGLILMHGGREKLSADYKEQFFHCGVIATVSMSFLLIFSIYPMRQKAYELFLTLHIGLALTLLVALFYHIRIWEGKFEPFLWPCVAIWVFDHFVRLMRLLVLNYKVLFLGHTKVLAVYNPDHDIIRLTFTPSYHRQPKPGTHYYLYFPFILKAVGNHPFTMSSWSESGQCSQPTSIQKKSSPEDQEKGMVSPDLTDTDGSSVSSAPPQSNDGATTIRFVIRPYKGLTAHLRDSIKKTGTGSREMTALIEGPYGETVPVFHYNTIIFIAGGCGITAVLPYMQEFLEPRSPQSRCSAVTKRIHIIWSARQRTFIQDVLDTELVRAFTNPQIKLDLFVTGASPRSIKEDELALDTGSAACLRYERPDIKSLLRERVGESVGTVAVFMCGPARLADDARSAAAEIVGGGFRGLEYFEEQFGW